MKRTVALLKRECALWWLSASPYISGTALLGASAYFFFRYLHSYEERIAQYRAGFLNASEVPALEGGVIEPYFQTLGFLFLVIVPILSSRLFSEERSSGFLAFLFSTPLQMHELVAMKFLGSVCNITVLVLLVSFPPIVLLSVAGQSVMPAILGALSLILLAGLYVSIGMALAQLVKRALPLSILHFSILMTLYFLPALSDNALGGGGAVLRWFSPVVHSGALVEGLLSTDIFAYFLGGTIGALLFAYRELHSERRYGDR